MFVLYYSPQPCWVRVISSALVALSGLLLQLGAGWWGVEATAARRLAIIAGVALLAALGFK